MVRYWSRPLPVLAFDMVGYPRSARAKGHSLSRCRSGYRYHRQACQPYGLPSGALACSLPACRLATGTLARLPLPATAQRHTAAQRHSGTLPTSAPVHTGNAGMLGPPHHGTPPWDPPKLITVISSDRLTPLRNWHSVAEFVLVWSIATLTLAIGLDHYLTLPS